MEYMKTLPDKYFELSIVDPPYGIGVDKMTMFDGAKKQNRHKEYSDVAPQENYFLELFRVSQNQIIWGGNYFNLPPTRCYLSWDKIQEFSGTTATIFQRTNVGFVRISTNVLNDKGERADQRADHGQYHHVAACRQQLCQHGHPLPRTHPDPVHRTIRTAAK